MANKLGSFGKTLGSKLKKNMGGLMHSKSPKPGGLGSGSGMSSGAETLEKKKKNNNSLKSWKGVEKRIKNRPGEMVTMRLETAHLEFKQWKWGRKEG